ncbi:hypothetical protein E4U54_008167, partial [Claviceps lovelessii]
MNGAAGRVEKASVASNRVKPQPARCFRWALGALGASNFQGSAILSYHSRQSACKNKIGFRETRHQTSLTTISIALVRESALQRYLVIPPGSVPAAKMNALRKGPDAQSVTK